MFHSLTENGVDMVICKGVKNGFACSAEFDQTGLLEDAKLVGDGRDLHTKHGGDVADAKLSFVKDIQNFDPRAVSKDLVKICQCKKLFLAWQMRACLLNAARMTLFFLAIRCNISQLFFSFQHLNNCSNVLYNMLVKMSICFKKRSARLNTSF